MLFLLLTISLCKCVFQLHLFFQEYRIFRICVSPKTVRDKHFHQSSVFFFPAAYLGLSERCISHRYSRISLTNHSSGRTACPTGWRASAGSRAQVWCQRFHHSSKDNSGNKNRGWCCVVNSTLIKCIILWVCSAFWNIQVEKTGGVPAQYAGQWLQSHRSVWAVQEPSWPGHSRWGWRRSETETKPTGYRAGAAFLQGHRETNTQMWVQNWI